jgi:putative membrane protein
MFSGLAHRRLSAAFAAGAVVALVVTACGKKEANVADSTAAMDTTPPAAATPASPTLSDAQIAHIAVTANSVDSASGAIAKAKAKNAGVKEFAQMMVTDHGAINKKASELARKLSLTPEDNDTSRQLQRDADQARTSWNDKTGADFDRAYIDWEVQAHQSVLDQLDQTLIPGAQNAELKALLQSVRPTVSAHLERAKQLQTTLGTASR